jgi:hypothetical protein
MYVNAQKAGLRSKHPLAAMNRIRVQGIWRQLAGRLTELRGVVTGDAEAVAAGKMLVQRGLAERLADRQLADFYRRNRNWFDLSS